MQRFCKLVIKCTRKIEFRLASVFLKKLEHLSHPILVLLFSFLTGICCLGKYLLTFCQINAVMSTYRFKTLHRFK